MKFENSSAKDLITRDNDIWPEFNKMGCDQVYEDNKSICFINKKYNLVIHFNKNRRYAMNVFKWENGELEPCYLDTHELQIAVNFLRDRGYLK